MKVHDNGYIEITTDEDAIEALQNAKNLQNEIEEVKAESGLDELEKDLTAYKAALRDFMIRTNIEHIPGDGFHGTLVKGSSGSRWITTDDDISENDPERVMSLQACIEKKFKSKVSEKGSKARKVWLKITKRVADPEAIEEAVNEKVLKVEDISPAWVELTRAPYLRIFED